MRTAELTGAALDWAVAKARHLNLTNPFPFSSEWRCGGTIIESEGIGLNKGAGGRWMATICVGGVEHICRYGQTPLVAAMRCYVASKLGEEVEIPDA
jgi:hypothetical protein